MFLKIKNRIINTDQVVDAKYEPASEWEDDEYDPPRKVNSPSSLTLTMTSISGQEVTGFDGDVLAAYSESDVIVLNGPEADDVWERLCRMSRIQELPDTFLVQGGTPLASEEIEGRLERAFRRLQQP
jgi:hypothetical protein